MRRSKSLTRTILEPMAVAIALAVIARMAVQIYSIPSRSMAPTLEAGDQIVVTPYLRSVPQRGHVVVFRSPSGGEELMVKRVIAAPGELVDARLGRVRVGGHTLPEPYVLRIAASGAISPQVVPAGSYYVLGDNREDSIDSRSWGVVREELIVGRARMVLWSTEAFDTGQASATSSSGAAVLSSRPRRLFKWIE